MIHGMSIFVGTVGSGVHVSRDGRVRSKQIFKPVPFEGNVRALRVRTRPIPPPSGPAPMPGCSAAATAEPAGRRSRRSPPVARCGPSPSTPPIPEGSTSERSPGPSVRPMAARRGRRWRSRWSRSVSSARRAPPTSWSTRVNPLPRRGVGRRQIDGVFRSEDHGATWTRCSDLGPLPLNGDVHGVAIRPDQNGDGATVLVGGPFGLTRSVHEGRTWELRHFPGFHERNEFAYCRMVMVKADDPQTIFVGTGDSIPGETGGLRISRDGGRSWTLAELPEEPNSVVYWMANHPDRPEVIACASLFGQLFWSTDGGDTWEKCRRGFGEIRSLALAPTVTVSA